LRWDTFTSWERDAERRVGYLGDEDWVPEATTSDDKPIFASNDEDEEDFEDDIKPQYVPSEIVDEVVGGKVVRDDTDNYVGHIAYHAL
jgi:hypothetical protein